MIATDHTQVTSGSDRKSSTAVCPPADQFHALDLAGCIDQLAVPLREMGKTVQWEFPHHSMEVSFNIATLLYQIAHELLQSALDDATTTKVDIHLTGTYHGIRLCVADDGDRSSAIDHSNPGLQGSPLESLLQTVEKMGGGTGFGISGGIRTHTTVVLPLD